MTGAPGVSVGEVTRLLERASGLRGITHYAIAAQIGGEGLILGCCDRLDETAALLSGALKNLTGPAIPVRSSPYVVVNRDDLAALLAGKAGTGATDRLRAAAGA